MLVLVTSGTIQSCGLAAYTASPRRYPSGGGASLRPISVYGALLLALHGVNG
jgi:hypothetical protein